MWMRGYFCVDLEPIRFVICVDSRTRLRLLELTRIGRRPLRTDQLGTLALLRHRPGALCRRSDVDAAREGRGRSSGGALGAPKLLAGHCPGMASSRPARRKIVPWWRASARWRRWAIAPRARNRMIAVLSPWRMRRRHS